MTQTELIARDWELNHQQRQGLDDIDKPWGWQWDGQALETQIDTMVGPYISGHALEIGCGGGKWLKWLFNYADEVTGVDVHEVAIRESGIFEPRATLELTDGESLPFPDDSFDIVICFDVLLHLPQTLVSRYFQESRRVGQQLVITLPDLTTDQGSAMYGQAVLHRVWRKPFSYGYMTYYAPQQIELMLEHAGWESHTLLGHVGRPYLPYLRDAVYLAQRTKKE